MKKILSILMLMVFTTMSVNAQKLAMDKVESDGLRILRAIGTNLYSTLFTAAGFSLGYIQTSDGYGEYTLYLTLNEGKIQIDKGRKLLIKFSDDSILELENDNKIGPADYTFNVTKLGTDYYVKPYYELTEEQLNELMSKDAVKVRIEYNLDVIDREIKKNKLSKGLRKMYAEIQKALSVKKDIYSDF